MIQTASKNAAQKLSCDRQTDIKCCCAKVLACFGRIRGVTAGVEITGGIPRGANKPPGIGGSIFSGGRDF
jgi:hypothetical protein